MKLLVHATDIEFWPTPINYKWQASLQIAYDLQ